MNNIIIDFSKYSFCFMGVSCKNFTNLLKDSDEFLAHFKNLIFKFLPYFASRMPNNLFLSNKHCHLIRKDQDSDKYNLVLDVIREIFNRYNEMDFDTFYSHNLNDCAIWQLGLIGGLRLVGTLNDNVFSVLFFDYNHLLYPDEKYNQKDYESNTFSPM